VRVESRSYGKYYSKDMSVNPGELCILETLQYVKRFSRGKQNVGKDVRETFQKSSTNLLQVSKSSTNLFLILVGYPWVLIAVRLLLNKSAQTYP